jgi:hypothetical protein
MNRTRNPRYAPESLERKLNPVGVPVCLATAALVFTPVSTLDPGSTTDPAPEPPYDWLPPIDNSPIALVPGGPA